MIINDPVKLQRLYDKFDERYDNDFELLDKHMEYIYEHNDPSELEEVWERIKTRHADCERINLIGKHPDAKLAGTVRATLHDAAAALKAREKNDAA